MKEKEREIWVGKNRIYLGEDNILYHTVVGDVDEKTAAAFKEADLTIRSKVKGKVNILIDLTRAEKLDPEARKIGKERLEDEGIGKVAFLGLHPVAIVTASFVMEIAKKRDIRFFRKMEEALDWLKE